MRRRDKAKNGVESYSSATKIRLRAGLSEAQLRSWPCAHKRGVKFVVHCAGWPPQRARHRLQQQRALHGLTCSWGPRRGELQGARGRDERRIQPGDAGAEAGGGELRERRPVRPRAAKDCGGARRSLWRCFNPDLPHARMGTRRLLAVPGLSSSLAAQAGGCEGGRARLLQGMPAFAEPLFMRRACAQRLGARPEQALRKDGATWVAKYARGGSARKVSARRMYIAIDALQGHLASNGFAPFPKNKVPVLLGNVQQSQQLLAEGK